MATNKIHYAMTMLFPIECSDVLKTRKSPISFDLVDAAKATTPDSMRCWLGPRNFSHFTINPLTREISGVEMPTADTRVWTQELVQYAKTFDAGKPGNAVVDEASIPEEFWKYNFFTLQNFLFYLHLVQDDVYDRFIRSVVDVSKRYDENPTFTFQGKQYTADDLRGKGMARWNDDGLLNQLDAQFYVRVAKRYYEKTGIKLNRQWVEEVMKPSYFEAYSKELAEKTIKFISIHDTAEQIITSGDFDKECWPVPNGYVDMYINWMMDDILNACIDHLF